MRAVAMLMVISVVCSGCFGTRQHVTASTSDALPAVMTYADCRRLIEIESDKACAAGT